MATIAWLCVVVIVGVACFVAGVAWAPGFWRHMRRMRGF